MCMSTTWKSVEFGDFIKEFGTNEVVQYAPSILHSKKDKEHEAFKSLVLFFVVSGVIAIYISVAILLIEIYFNLLLFLLTIIVLSFIDLVLIVLYLRSNININLLEMWVEIHKKQNNDMYFCLTYYPIFSGKCHPNKAINIIYKIYQEQYVKDKLDIAQIELYCKVKRGEKELTPIGFYFQYGEGNPFDHEKINRHNWRFFPYEKALRENYIATANWDHQFEWREDLTLDYDKLHEYAPWVVIKWNKATLKPLSESNKEALNWNLRSISSTPKLQPWVSNFDSTTFKDEIAYKDINIVNKAINRVMENGNTPSSLKDIRKKLYEFEAYFRDLSNSGK